MKNNRLLILLAVVLATIAMLVFYPGNGSSIEIDSGASTDANEQHELAVADSTDSSHEAIANASEPTAVEQRAEIDQVADPATEADAEKPPYAELVVRLYGENDSILKEAVAGILRMPEPGGAFTDLRPLFFAMQGRAPKSFDLNEVEVDDDGVAVLPLPKHKHGWVVYGRAFGRLVGFKVLNNIPAGDKHDAGVLVLRRGGSLRVEVSDEAGEPIANAGVLLVSEDKADPTEMPLHYLRTGADGVAEFHSLNFASYEMDVAHRGYLFIDKRRVAITERGEGLEKVVLANGGAIHGKVVDMKGQPVAGIPISIRAEHHRHRPQGLTEDLMKDQVWAKSGADGKFEGAGLLEDATYTVAAELSDEVAVRSTGHRIGDEVILKVNRTVKFRGKVVRADGTAAEGALIGMHAARKAPNITQLTLKTDADGRFEGDLLRGDYRLYVHHESGEYIHEEVIRVQAETALPDIQLPAGGGLELSFYQPDGTPQVQVYLSRITLMKYADADAGTKKVLGRLERLRRKDITTHENVCRVDGLSPGKVELRFHVPGYLQPKLTFEIQEGEVTREEIRLEEGGDVSLTITGPEGFNPQRLAYTMSYQDPVPDRHRHLRLNYRFIVDGNHQHTRKDLLPGTWAVFVAEDAKADVGGTPGAELGRFAIVPGSQSKSLEIR